MSPSALPARLGGARLAVLLASVLACAPAAPTASDDAPPTAATHLVLVSIDTLRADRLGTYGYGRPTSPQLDALAARGALFEQALSESSWTVPAHVSMLTGRSPEAHGVGQPFQRIPERVRLLSEHLAAAGFATFGSTDGVLVTATRGFDRGFERFDDRPKGLAVALAEARRFLEAHGAEQRALAFVHTYDVHCPYEPAPTWARELASSEAEPFDARGMCGNPQLNAMPLTPGQVRHLSDLYDGSVREADAHLGAFLRWLEESGRARHTLLVVTSDHGEAFGEHGSIGHERSLHRELLHVPWILAGPRVPAGRRVRSTVGLVDLAPTLLELLHVEPLAGIEGRSRVELLAPGAEASHGPAHRARLDWQVRLESLVTAEHHLIVDRDADRAQLYDWARDPLERNDLASAEPHTVERLRAELEALRAEEAPPAPSLAPEDLAPEDLERLRALGYVSD